MSKKDKKEQPQVRAQITITLFDNGQFQVNGPLHDHIMFYGLLEMARDSVLMHKGREMQQRQQAEAVKGSKPWWRKIFAGKVPNEGSRREGHSALRPDGKGGLEKFDPHPESAPAPELMKPDADAVH